MKESDIRNQEVLNRYLELVQKDCELYFKDIKAFPRVPCPACHYRQVTMEFIKNDFEYVTCKNCDTLFVHNRPKIKQLSAFYGASESSVYWINYFFKPFIEARRQKIFQPRVKSIIKTFGNNQKWAIGDIGAGFGIFLEELRKLWPKSQFVAIEPSLEQADICRNLGFEVKNCFLEELTGCENRFGLLTGFELFEHLYDPQDFLKSVYRLLKPGGYFFLTTLNGHGFDIQVLWKNAKAVSPPHHLNFFNPESITNLFLQQGFKIRELTTPGQLDWDIVERMITNENVVMENRFLKLLAYSRNQEGAKKEFQDWLVKNKLSSHMRVLVQKL